MARMTPHLCSYPYCPNVVEGPGRCAEHAYPRRSRNAGGVTPGGYGARGWREAARAYREAHPKCEAPGCLELADLVHHIDGRRPDDAGANAWTNLASLCSRHHRVITEHPDAFVL
jgi:hypothetical protein